MLGDFPVIRSIQDSLNRDTTVQGVVYTVCWLYTLLSGPTYGPDAIGPELLPRIKSPSRSRAKPLGRLLMLLFSVTGTLVLSCV